MVGGFEGLLKNDLRKAPIKQDFILMILEKDD